MDKEEKLSKLEPYGKKSSMLKSKPVLLICSIKMLVIKKVTKKTSELSKVATYVPRSLNIPTKMKSLYATWQVLICLDLSTKKLCNLIMNNLKKFQ